MAGAGAGAGRRGAGVGRSAGGAATGGGRDGGARRGGPGSLRLLLELVLGVEHRLLELDRAAQHLIASMPLSDAVRTVEVAEVEHPPEDDCLRIASLIFSSELSVELRLSTPSTWMTRRLVRTYSWLM